MATKEEVERIMEDTLTIDRMWAAYKEDYVGKDTRDQFLKTLYQFFYITLDVYIFGDTTIPEGCGSGNWDRAEAMDFWTKKCNLTLEESNKYFCAVDDIKSYT